MSYYDNLKPKPEKREDKLILDFNKWNEIFWNTRDKLNNQKETIYNLMLPLSDALVGDEDTASEITELKMKVVHNILLRDMKVGQEIIRVLDNVKQLVQLQNTYFTHLEEYAKGFITLCESANQMIQNLYKELDEKDAKLKDMEEHVEDDTRHNLVEDARKPSEAENPAFYGSPEFQEFLELYGNHYLYGAKRYIEEGKMHMVGSSKSAFCRAFTKRFPDMPRVNAMADLSFRRLLAKVQREPSISPNQKKENVLDKNEDEKV